MRPNESRTGALNETRDEFFRLMNDFCGGEMSSEQRTRLAQILQGSPRLQAEYFHFVHMHVCLRRALGGAPLAAAPLESLPIETLKEAPLATQNSRKASIRNERNERMDTPAASPIRSPRRFVLLSAALAAAVVTLALLLRFHENTSQNLSAQNGSAENSETVATLSDVRGCVWEGAVAPQRGSLLQPGRLVLNSGIAQLTFSGGTTAVLEAPAELELVSNARAFLYSGRIVVHAAHDDEGFVVDTARAEVLDHGTEFGVGVGNSGEMLVQVFAGSVLAGFKQAGVPDAEKTRLSAGQAMGVDGNNGDAPHNLKFTDERFIRRLPDPPEKNMGGQWLVPYNKARTASMSAVPAPEKVNIDGDLSDWDLSAPFTSRCGEPYGEHYNMQGYLMYDSQNLYIAAHVRDPSPMRSVIDPATDPNVGWKGGSVQLRICTDRSMGYPAKGEMWRREKDRLPEDISENLVHLSMWYYSPLKLPCLHFEYGMNLHGMKINPEGYHGAFKKDPDGRGYTLEYAVPWRLLNAEKDAPRAGDTLAACWNVHWSDDGGRVWKGYLVDLLNPKESGFTYARAATWGKAIFRK